jgi:four helix bundle protein
VAVASERGEEAKMKIYAVMLAMVKVVGVLSRKVQQHDPDLARQMRRSSSAVPLNGVEGWHAYGGNRVARFSTAMTEARETMAALDVSVANGYLLQAEVAGALDQLDHIVAVMWKLVRTRK